MYGCTEKNTTDQSNMEVFSDAGSMSFLKKLEARLGKQLKSEQVIDYRGMNIIYPSDYVPPYTRIFSSREPMRFTRPMPRKTF